MVQNLLYFLLSLSWDWFSVFLIRPKALSIQKFDTYWKFRYPIVSLGLLMPVWYLRMVFSFFFYDCIVSILFKWNFGTGNYCHYMITTVSLDLSNTIFPSGVHSVLGPIYWCLSSIKNFHRSTCRDFSLVLNIFYSLFQVFGYEFNINFYFEVSLRPEI